MEQRDWTVTAFPPTSAYSKVPTERHHATRSFLPVSWTRMADGSALVALDCRLGGRALHVDHFILRPADDAEVDAAAEAVAADLAAAGAVRP